ncbi:serine-type D-Ala-D-Ala carboxypeptidase [Sporosarcina newyorkensis 2681]|uniref:Serine-type D-Ala-D-Ala carboxypeptidase n=1 Tax=Sporosarcina newyorkensis 2681 TaxID=1027292 RepID=F9DTS8_9BACL|nr:M15 family metallopeptidase [Sporosarcina newyorkensis]EGQ25112.1 serine-type D-Ala-D-Ala carboxypeptidase [Sporosarcina newyorkensis 2681]
MKKRGRFSTQKRKRTTKWSNMIVGLIFILLIGSVVWIGANGWNVERAMESLQGNTEQPGEFEEIEPRLDHDATTESELEKVNEPEETRLREVKEAPNAAEDRKEGESTDQLGQGQKKPSNPIGYIEGQKLPAEPTYIKGVLIASKQYPLPKDFAPGESEEARAAFDEMAAAAATSGINLQAFSTYRSYDYQVTLYNRYVERDGREAADRYSARPGYSEHQTGLAFDIGEVNHEKHWASTSFGDTEAAKWLGANANQYGFILRYPEGKENITGYMHESWHYRYVGKEKAEQIFKRNITLEEYLGIHK